MWSLVQRSSERKVITSHERNVACVRVCVTHIVNINKDHKTLNFNFYKTDGEKMFHPLLRWFARTTTTTKTIKFQHIRLFGIGRRNGRRIFVCKQRSRGIQTAK